jgi:endonuclease YncB( thermonuclease family)
MPNRPEPFPWPRERPPPGRLSLTALRRQWDFLCHEGFSGPADWVQCRDGDTVVVSLLGNDADRAVMWPVRLLHCWAPEKNTPEGKAARNYAMKRLEQNGARVWLHCPPPEDPVKVLANVTFDRVLGWLWLGETTLNELVVRAGLACATRAEMVAKWPHLYPKEQTA